MAEDIAEQPAPAASDAKPAPAPEAKAPDTKAEPQKAEAPKTEPQSVLTAPGNDPAPGPAEWPDDWREKAASATVGKSEGKDYDKELKRLQRIASPVDLYKSFKNLETKMRVDGAPKVEFPADGTDEEKQAWRKEQGLPNAPAEYLKDVAFDDGLVIGETDQPAVDEFLATMHAENADPKYVKTALNTYLKIREKQNQELQARDRQEETKTRDALRDEMGRDFNRNLSAAYGLLQDAPEDVRNNLLAARLPNGTRLGNDPGAIKWLVAKAFEVNPAATVVPGGTDSSLKTIESEIAEIEKFRRENRTAYERDEKMNSRYLDLLDAKEKLGKRNAA